ncbi:MAG TPA: Hsp20/alpha crystallin family protein [Candidatus Krumholzibacterium sp.]|nr:Hsp20/alpha crystallin family protein [Candidatus Krumholzibacterium sp.]
MKLMKWYPATKGLTTLQDEMDELFNNLFLVNRRRVDMGGLSWQPRVDVVEHDDRYELTAEVPGMEKDEISIEVQDNTLSIRGEKKIEKEVNTDCLHICERRHGKFERSFVLPENVKVDKVDAEYKAGVLKISIPKEEKAKPKEIKVEVK